MSKFKEILGTVHVSKWSTVTQEWLPYSQAHDFLLIEFEAVKRENEVHPDEGLFLYQFESNTIDNIKTYFLANEYCI
jgi:hypothetical protein